MNLFKRATVSMRRQFGKSIVLFSLILILGTTLAGAISIRNAIIATEESLIKRLPAIATLTVDHHALAEANVPFESMDQPSVEQMEAVGSLSDVKTYDLLMETDFFSRDLMRAEMAIDPERLPDGQSIESISWAYEGARSRGASIELFRGTGVSNSHITDIEAGLISLVEGRVFTQEEIDNGELVVVVSQSFAEANNLRIGSLLEFENIAHDYPKMGSEGSGNFELDRSEEQFILASQTLEVEVIGIFEVIQEIVYEDHQESWHFTRTLSEHSNLYNRIYLPIGVVEDMRGFVSETILELDEETLQQWRNPGIADLIEEQQPTAIFILDDPRHLETFATEASALLPDFWEIGDVSASFNSILSSMDMVLQIANSIQWATVIASAVVLTLFIILFLRDRRHEIGVYMALGDRKRNVVAQIIIEVGLVAVVALTFSLFAGNMIADTISRQMLRQNLTEQMQESNEDEEVPWELTLFNPNVGVEDMMEMYDVSLDSRTVIMVMSVGVIVISASTVIPIWYVVKLEPKEILL